MEQRSGSPSSEWIACKELAKRLLVTPATIRDWARRGVIPATKPFGAKSWKFHWATIDAALLATTTPQHTGGTDGDDGDEPDEHE